MVNTIKRMDFLHRTSTEITAYTEIMLASHKDAPDVPRYIVFSTMRAITHGNNLTQTAKTDTVQDYSTLAEALACMEKWRVSREQTGSWQSLVTIDRTEEHV